LFWLILAKKKKICINKDCEEKGTSKKKKKETTKIK
jgi:hypothetical protein